MPRTSCGAPWRWCSRWTTPGWAWIFGAGEPGNAKSVSCWHGCSARASPPCSRFPWGLPGCSSTAAGAARGLALDDGRGHGAADLSGPLHQPDRNGRTGIRPSYAFVAGAHRCKRRRRRFNGCRNRSSMVASTAIAERDAIRDFVDLYNAQPGRDEQERLPSSRSAQAFSSADLEAATQAGPPRRTNLCPEAGAATPRSKPIGRRTTAHAEGRRHQRSSRPSHARSKGRPSYGRRRPSAVSEWDVVQGRAIQPRHQPSSS